jgi:GT2 family glycosyltransferase
VSAAVSRPHVSVIVVTYNSAPFICACLRAAIEQTYPAFEIVAVDNASSDGTSALIREQFPGVRLVESSENLGYGGGNNCGARSSSGEVFVFLNPDTIVESGWLEALIDGMTAGGSGLATSKITLLSDPGRLNTSGNQIHYLGLSYCRGWKHPRSAYAKPELVSGASGASLAITRDLFQRLDGFDESLFMYHDDVDLSLRALLAGEQCLYVPDSIAGHDYELRLPPHKWAWVESHRYAVLLKTYRLRTLAMLLPGLLLVDLMTLGYLATQGQEYVRAKLATYGWLTRNWRAIRDARRRTQRQRAIDDRRLLGLLVDTIPFEQLSPAWIARIASALIGPVFAGHRRLVQSVVHW